MSPLARPEPGGGGTPTALGRAPHTPSEGSGGHSPAMGDGGPPLGEPPPERERPLRVLFAVDSRFPGLGGAETQALKLALALRERGVEIEFLTPRVRLSQPLEETYHGFRVARVDYPHVRWLGSLALLANVARRLVAERGRFDAVHVHVTHLMAAGAGLVRRRSGLPVVTKISGFYEFEGGVLDPNARWKPLNRLIRHGLARVDRVQTISEQTRAKLVDAGFRDEQIAFVPNGVDTREPPPPRASDGVFRIGYCGRLRAVKGVHVLLEGFARTRAARPDASLELAIAGDGETREALEAQAHDLGIDDALVWLGHVDETGTGPFYASLDAYVQPSFAEGLPNSVMEAMLAARAVVASEVGGNTDLVADGECGLLFPAGDAEALAARLVRLVDEPATRAALGAAGRSVIDARYGFDAVVEGLLALYRLDAPS